MFIELLLIFLEMFDVAVGVAVVYFAGDEEEGIEEILPFELCLCDIAIIEYSFWRFIDNLGAIKI